MSNGGRDARWTTRGLLLALVGVAVVVGLAAAQKAPCAGHERHSTRYADALCYTDIPVLYAERGLDLPVGWFGGESARRPPIEYPPLTVLFMEASAKITHRLDGDTPAVLAAREAGPLEPFPSAARESTFYWVSAAGLAVLGIAALGLLCGLLGPDRTRRFAWVAAPLVVVTGFVNWDLIAMFLVVAALASWRAGRPVLTGVCLGLGAAAKLFPVLLLGPIIALAVRDRRYRPAALAAGAAALAWTAVDLPAYLLHPEAWKAFWHFSSVRRADFGSPWFALHLLGIDVPTAVVNAAFLGWMLAVCVAVLLLAWRAPTPPTLEVLALVLVTAFIVANKVNSPQYVLWMLPLVALTGTTRWRLLALWVLAELAYYVVVLQYLAYVGWWLEPLYLVVLVLRLVAEVAVAWVVLRDALRGAPTTRRTSAAPRVEEALHPTTWRS